MTTTPVVSFKERNQELAEGFTRWLISRHRSAMTLKSYGETIAYLLEFIGAEDATQTDRRMLSTFLGALYARGPTPSSVNRHTFALRAFYKWLTWAEVIARNPMRLIPSRKLPSYLPRTVSNEEIEKLLRATINPRDRAIVEMTYGAGLRVSDVCQIRRQDLEFGDGTFGRVRIHHGKGDKERVAYFGSKAIQALQDYYAKYSHQTEYVFESHTGRPLSSRAIRLIFATLSRKAGIRHLNPHALRHGAATAMHGSGANIRVIQEFLGHSAVTVTAHYLRSDIQKLKEAHANFHPHGGKNDE